MSHFHDIALAPQIIARARHGDIAAQTLIYRTYAQAVYSLARRLVVRPAIAEELLQETFIEVLCGLPSYRGEGSFSGWVRAIAVSKCLHHLRSPWHRSLRWFGVASEDGVNEIADDAPLPETQVGTNADLERALQCLPPMARTVVWLHDVEGYTHAEIAQLLKRTPSFSKSQLARAHERLRGLFDSLPESLPCTPVSTNC